MSRTGSGSSASWSRRSWSATTPSPFGMRFRSRPDRQTTPRHRRAPQDRRPTKVTFCVQGVMIPPCGVPVVVSSRLPSSTTPAFSQRRDHGGEHRHARQQRRMIDGVEALGDVGIEDPLAAALAGERDMDGLDRIHRASPWPETVAVRLEARLPLRLQRQLDDGLHYPVRDRRYAQRPPPAVALRDINPTDRLGMVALEAQTFPEQRESMRRQPAHLAVDPWCFPAAIDLRHLTDRQKLRGSRPNEELLKVPHLRRLAVLAGPKDPFLQPSYGAFHGRPAGPVVEIATPVCPFSAAH